MESVLQKSGAVICALKAGVINPQTLRVICGICFRSWMTKLFQRYLALIGVNLIYACTSIFTKMASQQEILSWPYLLWIASAVGVMGLYAILWQQVIKRMEISTAYMFKGTSLIFVLLISALFFGEVVTVNNIIGSIIIVGGIVLFAKV